MDWDSNERGNITVSPLMGFEMRVALGTGCCVRMVLAVHPGPPQGAATAVQVAMTLAQAQDFVLGLQRTIDQILAPSSIGPRN